MKTEHKEILKKTACEVFEQYAFMFMDLTGDEPVECCSVDFIRSTMVFKGVRSGSLEIIVPTELAKNLAVNVLGIDDFDELEPGSTEDALKELLNTICGILLTEINGDEAVFDLSVPETSKINHKAWENLLETEDCLVINIEDEPVLIKAIL